MLFRRQNDQTTNVNTQNSATSGTNTNKTTQNQTNKPLTARPNEPTNVRTAPMTATPTAPIAQAQQRRVIATPAGSFSMPSGSSTANTGNRKLQVGRDITLNGEIGACDHLVIEGTVSATIKHLQQFDILDHGQFTGSVTTDNADINGSFEGELNVTGRLWLRQNATVKGTVRYSSLQVEKGARLHGTVDMYDTQVVQQPIFSQNNETLNAANDSSTTDVYSDDTLTA